MPTATGQLSWFTAFPVRFNPEKAGSISFIVIIIIIIITEQHNKINIKLMFNSYIKKILGSAKGEHFFN